MPRARLSSVKAGSTDSLSHRQSGCTWLTSRRARSQNSSGTSGATSQRKPSTMDAHILSVSIW